VLRKEKKKKALKTCDGGLLSSRDKKRKVQSAADRGRALDRGEKGGENTV